VDLWEELAHPASVPKHLRSNGRGRLSLLTIPAIKQLSDLFRLPFAIALALAVHRKMHEDCILPRG